MRHCGSLRHKPIYLIVQFHCNPLSAREGSSKSAFLLLFLLLFSSNPMLAMLHNACGNIVKPPKSAIADSRNVSQCCLMSRNGLAWRIRLGNVASQQQEAEKRPDATLSAWRNGTIAPMHHRGASHFGTDCKQIRRSSVVSLGQAWSTLACRSVLAGPGEQGPAPTVCRSGTPLIPFANFRRAKKFSICPFSKMPKDWREGTLAAFSGCGLGDGEQKG